MTETATAQAISPSTARSYHAIWDLFVDWCAAADHTPLPADPATVLQFLTECSAAPATQRRRVLAIDHHHTARGLACPGEDDRVRAAVGRPPKDPVFVARSVDAVHAALRMLPSSGWTAGVFGRRDGCLLVLAELAGIPCKHIASLTAGDIVFDDGIVVIATRGVTYRLTALEDRVLCPGCAVGRWLEVLDVAVRELATVAVAQHLRRAETVTSESPHVCRSWAGIGEQTTEVPLLAPIDQWGSFPFPLQRLSPHAVSRQTRDLVAGDLTAHRDRPVPGVEDTAEQPTLPPPALATLPYTAADRAAAWQRRRADLNLLAGVADDLADVEHRADQLNRRVATLLEQAGVAPA